MRLIDELYLTAPFYGSRRMVAVLRRDGWTVNRKRVRRLMARMVRLAAASASSDKPGHVCATSSPYSRQNHASSPPTTSTVRP